MNNQVVFLTSSLECLVLVPVSRRIGLNRVNLTVERALKAYQNGMDDIDKSDQVILSKENKLNFMVLNAYFARNVNSGY